MKCGFQTSRKLLAAAVLLCAGLPMGVAQQGDPAGQQYAAADGLQKRGVYNLAAQEWTKFLRLFPNDARIAHAHHFLGVCYYQHGKAERALEEFQTVIGRYPTFELLQDTYFYLGATQYALGASRPEMYDRAVETLEALSKKFPQGDHVPDALYCRGECLYARGKTKEAIAAYGELLAKFPRHKSTADAMFGLAVAQQETGQQEAAGKTFDAILTRFPDYRLSVEVGMRRGDTLLACAHPAEAVRWFAAAEARPGFTLADYAMLRHADALVKLNRDAEAAKLYEQMATQFPKSPLLDRACFRLGECAMRRGDAAAAATQFDKAVSSWPQSPLVPQALHELACAQLSRGGAAAAEATLGTLLDRYPGHPLVPRALYARAMAHHTLQKFAAAADDLKAALAVALGGQERCDARFLLGLCEVELKRPEAATATFRSLLASDPKYAGADEAQFALGSALKSLGREAEAVEVFGQLAAAHPDSPLAGEALWNVGESAFVKKDYRAAARAFYDSVKNLNGKPAAEKAVYQLARCYYHQGEYADAERTFSYLRRYYPDGAHAANAAFMEAECLLKQQRFADALTAYEHLPHALDPQSQAQARLHAGQAAARLKQWDQSARWLEDCFRQFPRQPTAPDALCDLGVARRNQGREPEAAALYEQAIAVAGQAGRADSESAARGAVRNRQAPLRCRAVCGGSQELPQSHRRLQFSQVAGGRNVRGRSSLPVAGRQGPRGEDVPRVDR